MDEMGLYDGRILAALRDGKSSARNTSRLHLAQLVEHGLVARRKRPQQGLGRPRFSYSLAKGIDGRAVSVLVDLYKGLVTFSYDELQHPCRHEKGGYCKEIRGRCAPRNCPKIKNKNNDHFYTNY